MTEALRLTTEGHSPCPLPFSNLPSALGNRSPGAHTGDSFGFRDLLLTPGAHRSLTPQSGQAAARHPPLQVGPPDKVQTPVGGGSRPFPRVARPGAASPGGGGRAGAGRRRGSQGRQAGLGARSLPRRAGRWRVGQWLLQPGSCCSRSGGCGGPAGAALGLRADALPLSAAAGAAAAAARPGAAPELSNSGGRGAEAPGGGPSAERLRALPRPGEGRVPGACEARPARGCARARPSGPAHDPGVWTRRRHCRAPKLVTVYQAGTGEAHTLGRMRRDRSGARCHCRVSRSIAAYKSRLSRRARTARVRRLRPDPGSARCSASGLKPQQEFLATAEVPKPGCQAARWGGSVKY